MAQRRSQRRHVCPPIPEDSDDSELYDSDADPEYLPHNAIPQHARLGDILGNNFVQFATL